MPNDNENLSLLLIKARESVLACLKPVLSKYDITEQQWRVIRVLYDKGDVSANVIASDSCILSPSLSRILSRLDSDGIIIRKADKSDQRSQSIRLSAKGKKLHQKISPAVEKEYQALTKSVGKDTVAKLMPLLTAYSAYGEEHGDL